jgi:hypothetical protein
MRIPPIVTRQQLGKHVPATTNTHATIEQLLGASFSVRSVSYQGSVCLSPTVARQRLGKHVPAATNTHATIEQLLEASFSVLSVSYQRKVGDLFFSEVLVSSYNI